MMSENNPLEQANVILEFFENSEESASGINDEEEQGADKMN